MALDESGLSADILSLLNSSSGKSPEQTRQDYAAGLAAAIVKCIKTGTVPSGIAVQVSPGSGTGSTTGTGSIS